MSCLIVRFDHTDTFTTSKLLISMLEWINPGSSLAYVPTAIWCCCLWIWKQPSSPLPQLTTFLLAGALKKLFLRVIFSPSAKLVILVNIQCYHFKTCLKDFDFAKYLVLAKNFPWNFQVYCQDLYDQIQS